jgi:2-polyprenyl-6-methoxyphenol hydroxylase-like FAD-dependent oxidoreductase
MTLHWGSTHISSCLPESLAARFHEAYADPSLKPDVVRGLPIYNGSSGELLMTMASENPCRVSRKKMRNLFSEGIDIQYGKRVSAAHATDDGRVRVEFVDGGHATGDIIVGADGAKSQLRESILGAEAAALTSAPVCLFNFPQKFPAELAREIRAHNDLFITSIHPDHGTMFWLSSTHPSLFPRSTANANQSWTCLTPRRQKHGRSR